MAWGVLDGGEFTGINAKLDMFLDSGYSGGVMANHNGAGSPVDSKIAEVLGKVEQGAPRPH